jgi:hypothetical protein
LTVSFIGRRVRRRGSGGNDIQRLQPGVRAGAQSIGGEFPAAAAQVAVRAVVRRAATGGGLRRMRRLISKVYSKNMKQLPKLGVGRRDFVNYSAPNVFLHQDKIDFLDITADHIFDANQRKLAEWNSQTTFSPDSARAKSFFGKRGRR